MALTDENTSGIPATMLVGPTGYAGGNNGGFGFGGDWAWILLLLLIGGNGWGMGGFGGGAMWPMMMGGFGLGYDFPWLLNGQQGINNNVSSGFRDAQLHDSITSVRDGVSNLATQLCGCCGDMQMGMANGFSGVQQTLSNGFAGVNQNLCQTGNGITAAVTGAQNSISQQLNQNQLASLARSFAAQTANTAALNAIQTQQAQCCCDNRAGLADLKYTVATENCADRAALSEGIRDLLAAQAAGIQSIKDQLCADKLEAKNDLIAQLRQENLYIRGQAAAENLYQRGQNSQDVQTAQILAGQANIPGQVYTRLSECPVGTVPVFGNQPIFTCPTNVGMNNCGCGCGCNG